MKLKLEPTKEQKKGEFSSPVVEIEIATDEVNLEELLDDLIKPALLAYGFNDKSVERIKFDHEHE